MFYDELIAAATEIEMDHARTATLDLDPQAINDPHHPEHELAESFSLGLWMAAHASLAR